MLRKFLFYMIISVSAVYSQQSSLSIHVNKISDYIASEYFARLRKSCDDISLMDTLFRKSVEINCNDVSEALLSLTFAAIPYRKFSVVIPLIKIELQYPLISASDSVFLLKNKNLPSKLFFDSPETDYGDKDKIAHFFGNAFLGYHSGIFNMGNLPGYFVEVFEKTFRMQSDIDERDMTANFFGKAFGKAVRQKRFVLPSQSLILHPLLYSIFQI